MPEADVCVGRAMTGSGGSLASLGNAEELIEESKLSGMMKYRT